jgi:7-dehydrocholesterol reductase
MDFWLRVWGLPWAYNPGIVKFLGLLTVWAGASQFLPGETYKVKTPTVEGHVPEYRHNGMLFYFITCVAMVAVDVSGLLDFTGFFLHQYQDIVLHLQWYGCVVAILLYIKPFVIGRCPGEYSRSGFPIFDFYWGTELYPRLFGVDVKMLTNNRFGMILWQIVIYAFWRSQPTNSAALASFLLQSYYCAKFYHWEEGYMNSIDIITDRGGFYICYGCIGFLAPIFCTESHYFAVHAPQMPLAWVLGVVVTCFSATTLQYWIDQQRLEFRQQWPKPAEIWGKPAEFIVAKYEGPNGEIKSNPLLCSGYWGLARHTNYMLEWVITFCFGVVGGFESLIPFTYFLTIFIITFHRSDRDDAKCSAKYGTFFAEYKQKVPYRIVPGVY